MNGRFQDLLTGTSTGMNGRLLVISVEITSVLLVFVLNQNTQHEHFFELRMCSVAP